MAIVIEHRKFAFYNAGINSAKVWEVLLYDNAQRLRFIFCQTWQIRDKA